MSAHGFFAASDAELISEILEAVRSDAEVQAVLGNPARLFDDETRGAAYPYAMLERHERLNADASEVCGAEHRLQFVTMSRHGGRTEAKEVLGALRFAVEHTAPTLSGQRVVLAHVTYSDAMRSRDRRAFRGVLRARILTEEI